MGQRRALVLKIALVVIFGLIFCLQGGHQLQGLTGSWSPVPRLELAPVLFSRVQRFLDVAENVVADRQWA